MTDSLLDRARKLGTPLIDGNHATFVWDGADEVRLIGDWTHWESGPVRLRKRAGGWRALTAEFPADAYLEYAFVRSESEVRLPDPFNQRRLAFADGSSVSFFSMPDRPQNQLIRRRADVPQGRITKHRMGTAELVAGHLRTVHLYQPPGRGAVPLLVVLDGADYLARGSSPGWSTISSLRIESGRLRWLWSTTAVWPGRPSTAARMERWRCSTR